MRSPLGLSHQKEGRGTRGENPGKKFLFFPPPAYKYILYDVCNMRISVVYREGRATTSTVNRRARSF